MTERETQKKRVAERRDIEKKERVAARETEIERVTERKRRTKRESGRERDTEKKDKTRTNCALIFTIIIAHFPLTRFH